MGLGLIVGVAALGVGSALGLIIAYNVVEDSAGQPSWQGSLHFAVPWTHLVLVFLLVYAAALLTTLAPARAARVYPAEALCYSIVIASAAPSATLRRPRRRRPSR